MPEGTPGKLVRLAWEKPAEWDRTLILRRDGVQHTNLISLQGPGHAKEEVSLKIAWCWVLLVLCPSVPQAT